jgi:hypothetical protein
LEEVPKQRPITEEGIPLAIIPASWCLTEEQKDTTRAGVWQKKKEENLNQEKLWVGRFGIGTG